MRKDVMLCYLFSQKRFTSWQKPAFAQAKIEGDRCRAVIEFKGYKASKVTLFSSQGNVKTSVPHINEQLMNISIPVMQTLDQYVLELDGELYVPGMKHHVFRRIVSPTTRIHPDSTKVTYQVFDVINSDAQYDRIKQLDLLRMANTHLYDIHFLKSFDVSTETEVLERMNEFMNLGYEGIIVRDRKGFYVRYRSTHIMKLKPRMQESFLIMGYNVEVDKDGFSKEALGSLTCITKNKQAFCVGTGSFLTREVREESWKDADRFCGKQAIVLFQGYTERGVPYFPSLLEVR
jgi:ATP-dependent DNA ligase